MANEGSCVVYITEKSAHKHAQNTTFGPTGFIFTCFIYLRSLAVPQTTQPSGNTRNRGCAVHCLKIVGW